MMKCQMCRAVGVALAVAFFFGVLPPSVRAEESQGETGHAAQLNWYTHGIDADSTPPISIREQRPPLVYMFINFVIVVVAAFLLARKPISRMLRNRRDSVALAINEAEALKKEAELAIENARARMAAMDAEMEVLRHSIVEAGVHQAKRIEEDTVLRSARLREDTRAIVAHEIARLSVELRAEVVDEIVSTAARLISEQITAADQTRLSEQYIAGVSESANVGLERR